MRNRDERLRHQREYYKEHREEILKRKRVTGFLTYGDNKRNNKDERREQDTTTRGG